METVAARKVRASESTADQARAGSRVRLREGGGPRVTRRQKPATGLPSEQMGTGQARCCRFAYNAPTFDQRPPEAPMETVDSERGISLLYSSAVKVKC